MKNRLKELYTALSIVLMLVLILVNPFEMHMNGMFLMSSLIILIILFAFSTIFFWQTKSVDERDEANLQFSGRVSYLIGTVFMMIGIIYQAVTYTIDIWLVLALLVVILSQLFARIYSDIER